MNHNAQITFTLPRFPRCLDACSWELILKKINEMPLCFNSLKTCFVNGLIIVLIKKMSITERYRNESNHTQRP